MAKILTFFRKEKLDAEMSEEMRVHLELQTAENLARGMAPEDARDAALRSFGGLEQIKERARDQRGWRWAEEMKQDVRGAWRGWRKNPGFVAVIVLSLAIGVGANSAVFSRINDRVLKMLPVKAPEELVLLQWIPGPQGGKPRSDGGDAGRGNLDRETGLPARRVFSWRTFEALRDSDTLLTDLFAVGPVWGANARVGDQTEVLRMTQVVSGNYYAALGVTTAVGRTLRMEDDQPGAAPVAVISHRYWQTRFAGDPDAIGKTVILNQTPMTIVGVTPADFRDTISDGDVDITMPLAVGPRVRFEGDDLRDSGLWWLRVAGRLKPGATMEQARSSLEASFQASAREGVRPESANDLPRLRVLAGGYGSTEADRQHEASLLKIELGITGLVLLAACVNVANLLLARGAARRRELAVRLALGASRRRLVRQLLTENVLLAGVGAIVSLGFAAWGVDLLSLVQPDGKVPPLDGRVLGFTAGIALLASIGFGVGPALRATRLDLTAEFQGGRGQLGGGRSRLGHVLVVLQVALSLVLLVGAGLFMRTVRNLRASDVGFDRTNLVLFSLDPSWAGYSSRQTAQLNERVAERVAALPGIDGATYSKWPILNGYSGFQNGISIPGHTPPGEHVLVAVAWVAPNFFETYRIPLVAGRRFEAGEGATGPRVAIVNQAFVRKFFGAENPVGRRFRMGRDEREIVGVTRDVKQQNFRAPTEPTVFAPMTQSGGGAQARATFFAVRTSRDPAAMIAAIRSAVREVDPIVPLMQVQTQDDVVERRLLASERLFERMSILLGLLALALTCIGLYGLMSYAVHRRTGEIGLRMALGARPRAMLTMVLRESLGLVVLGVAAGLAAAVAASRLVRSLLYELSPLDPVTYGAAIALLVGVAILAALWPARRAAKVDPMVALRAE